MFEDVKTLEKLRLEAYQRFIDSVPENENCLTLDEERDLKQLVEETALKFCESFKPPMPKPVVVIAAPFGRRCSQSS